MKKQNWSAPKLILSRQPLEETQGGKPTHGAGNEVCRSSVFKVVYTNGYCMHMIMGNGTTYYDEAGAS